MRSLSQAIIKPLCNLDSLKGNKSFQLFGLDVIAYEVKLEFDDDMRISAVYARKHGCDFELMGGLKADGSFRKLNKSAFKKLRRGTGRNY